MRAFEMTQGGGDGKARRLAREFVEEKFRNAAEDAFDFNNVLSEP